MKNLEKNYQICYTKISAPFRKHPHSIDALKIINKVLTIIPFVMYPLLLIFLWSEKDAIFWKILLYPAVGFVLLSLFRRGINRARPYQTWAIDPLIVKRKRGCSMPSRHVFSSVVIAMAFVKVVTILGIIFFIISFFTGFIRIVGGVHYPSDVLVGIACGVIVGLFI